MQARMSGVRLPPGMTPDMMKQASQMLSQMSPADLDRIAAQASSAMPGASPAFPAAAAPAASGNSVPQPAASSGVSASSAGQPAGMGASGFQQAAKMMQVWVPPTTPAVKYTSPQ